jgi:hypothetical protein
VVPLPGTRGVIQVTVGPDRHEDTQVLMWAEHVHSKQGEVGGCGHCCVPDLHERDRTVARSLCTPAPGCVPLRWPHEIPGSALDHARDRIGRRRAGPRERQLPAGGLTLDRHSPLRFGCPGFSRRPPRTIRSLGWAGSDLTGTQRWRPTGAQPSRRARHARTDRHRHARRAGASAPNPPPLNSAASPPSPATSGHDHPSPSEPRRYRQANAAL